jgi:hypothetical protein
MGEAGIKLAGPGGPEGGPGPDYVAKGFVFLGSFIIYRLYKLTIPDQAQDLWPVRPFFWGGGGGAKKHFHWGRAHPRRPWLEDHESSQNIVTNSTSLSLSRP